MATSDYKVVGGYYTARQSPQLVDVVNAEISAGWQPYGTPMLRGSGWVDQPMVKADTGTITQYRVATGYNDNRTPQIGALPGWNLLGDTVRLDTAFFLQAYVMGQPVVPEATSFGASLLQLVDAAALKALIPPVNEVFRASYTTTGSDAVQNCVTNNVAQPITFNTQQIPNAVLGTLVNATGVFTAAKAISGILSIACQVRRDVGGSAALQWGVQVETSPDGIVWTPVTGGSRRISMRGATENNLSNHLNFAVSLSLPAGTMMRFTQSTDNVSAGVGITALASGIGQTTSAGFIFSLYTVD
nr:MAG: protein of unknown function DUF1737 [Bacteriophage sp.]